MILNVVIMNMVYLVTETRVKVGEKVRWPDLTLAVLAPFPYARPEEMPPLTQHMAGCLIGETYPAPVVDHETAYRLAKERIFDARGTSRARQEASRVYRKHGSRSRRTERR
ncbi:MAG: hypothetical protein GWP75_01070 [Planctomycetia bacterium]|nr:hypothetical protein [Planctomycetia bacterium]